MKFTIKDFFSSCDQIRMKLHKFELTNCSMKQTSEENRNRAIAYHILCFSGEIDTSTVSSKHALDYKQVNLGFIWDFMIFIEVSSAFNVTCGWLKCSHVAFMKQLQLFPSRLATLIKDRFKISYYNLLWFPTWSSILEHTLYSQKHSNFIVLGLFRSGSVHCI